MSSSLSPMDQSEDPTLSIGQVHEPRVLRTPSAAPAHQRETDWDGLSELLEESLGQETNSVRHPTSKSEKLLRVITRLAERILHDHQYGEMARELVSAGRDAFSKPFSQLLYDFYKNDGIDLICETPDILIEEENYKALFEQLREWVAQLGGLENPSLPKERQWVASLRAVGGQLWFELRAPGSEPLLPLAEGKEAGKVKGIAMTEHYTLPRDGRILRARVDNALPAFEAYELVQGGRGFLVPAADVLGILGPHQHVDAEELELGKLLELPAEWVDRSSRAGQKVVTQFRGKKIVLHVDQVMGPGSYLARNVAPAGKEARGIAGVASLGDGGEKAVVLDLIPWFEGFGFAAEKPQTPQKADPQQVRDYVIVRVATRRFAIPKTLVRDGGRIAGGAWIMRVAEGKKGAYALRDLKELMGMTGDPGSLFVAIEGSSGVIAWAVDHIEKVLQGYGGTIEPLQLMGRTPERSFVSGVLKVPGENAPVFLLNVEALLPRKAA